ncbi:universal stress protein [Leucobacter sp. HY1910]
MTSVVVGVSASSGSPQALRAAATEARQRGAGLLAVQAWRAPIPPAAPGGKPPGVSRDIEAALASAQRTLRSRVTAVLGPDEAVTCKVVQGAPSTVLLAEAAHAELLVLDAPRTRASMKSPVLAHRLIYTAECPVLIMPPAPEAHTP